MNVIPAIDVLNGECVRLYQGNFNQVKTYGLSPLLIAQQFASEGAKDVHVVDLEGAKVGQAKRQELIKEIAALNLLNVQIGGGIRSAKQIEDYLATGAKRVVVGTFALLEPLQVKHWLTIFGSEQIVLAFDIKWIANDFYVMTQAWQNKSNMTLWQALKIYQDFDLQHVLCTDISCDGVMEGPNITLYQSLLQKYPHLKIQASGGVSSLDDLKQLKAINVKSVIVGKALYEKRFSYSQARSIEQC